MIGEAIIDSYLHGTADRICREAPVPIVAVKNREDLPGGAANTAVNVRSLGAQVAFLSVVGDDREGDLLCNALEARGVPTEYVLREPGRGTLAKNRVMAGSQILVRFDDGTTGPMSPEIERALIGRLEALFPECDAVIVSDYGYGILTPRVIDTLKRLQKERPRVLVADSKYLPAYRNVGVTAVKPNYGEVVQLLGYVPEENGEARVDRITRESERLLDITGAQFAAVTLDTEGAVIIERGNPPYRTYARPAAHSRAVGAGDTFVSTLALALAAGADRPEAAELASAGASIVVAKDGTAVCSAGELREHFSAGDKYMAGVERLAARVDFYRQQGRRIVFTNGCFDILHRGHITFLNRAKALGDVLIVGVNGDASVRRLKGEGRPINSLEDRVQVLAALSCIDHIVPFDEDTPVDLLRAVCADVVVKGGNYSRETLPEAALAEELGGRVEILPIVEDLSTTGIIRKIQEVLPTPVPVPTFGANAEEAAQEPYLDGLAYSDSAMGAA